MYSYTKERAGKSQITITSEPLESDLHCLVLQLGSFHSEISFLGVHILSGSGLQELLEVMYVQNTFPRMLFGTAVAREIRGHLLVDSGLQALVTAKTFNTTLQ